MLRRVRPRRSRRAPPGRIFSASDFAQRSDALAIRSRFALRGAPLFLDFPIDGGQFVDTLPAVRAPPRRASRQPLRLTWQSIARVAPKIRPAKLDDYIGERAKNQDENSASGRAMPTGVLAASARPPGPAPAVTGPARRAPAARSWHADRRNVKTICPTRLHQASPAGRGCICR